jgi:hypothetical protein
MSLGFGYLQTDIWDFTFQELLYMAEGQNKRLEDEYKTSWEQTRWLAYLNVQPYLDKNSKVKEPADLLKFPWEKKAKKEVDWEKIKKLDKLFEFEGKEITDGIRRFKNQDRD